MKLNAGAAPEFAGRGRGMISPTRGPIEFVHFMLIPYVKPGGAVVSVFCRHATSPRFDPKARQG